MMNNAELIGNCKSFVPSLTLAMMLLAGATLPPMLSGCDTSKQADKTNVEVEEDAQLTEHLASASVELTKAQANGTAESDLPAADIKNSDTIMSLNDLSTEAPASSRNKAIDIDWAQIDSDVEAINSADFDYPFALDSNPVKSYAQYFKVTPSEAQHSLTIGMASNEPLDGLLTQLGDSYVSHELTDGKDIRLIVHTTPNVTSSTFNYVIANTFARGLILPIEIKPDAKVSQ